MTKGKKYEIKNPIGEGLYEILATTFVLSCKCRHYHWNVTGMNFLALHDLFQEFYEYFDEIGDVLAERLRALGEKPLGSLLEFQRKSVVKEEITYPQGINMLKTLGQDLGLLSILNNKVKEMALNAHDDVTADLLIEYVGKLQKFGWMVRSHYE